MSDTCTISDAVTALATLLLAGAAIGATIAAFMGLETYKKQSLWRSDYEFARRALLTLYKYRDTLYAVRHPAMSSTEMQLTDEERSGIRANSDRSAGVIGAYIRRWERHSSNGAEIEAILLEADAIWGSEFRELFEPLRELQAELNTYIQIHIAANLRGDTHLADNYRETLRDRRDILYDLQHGDDAFRMDFQNGLSALEAFLRPKLGRRRK